MHSGSPFTIDILSAAKNTQPTEKQDIFIEIAHKESSCITLGQPDTIQLGLPPLADDKIEIWHSTEQITRGQHRQINYQHSDTFLIGHLILDEASHPDLAESTLAAYQQIHDTLEDTGFPALIRMWNFFPRINEVENGLERYRTFCKARHQALDEWHFTEEQLPAASAIGTYDDKFVIYFLAARQPGIQIENPRQVSAFHYPKQYGPKSPSFSRATLKNWGKTQHLYISGTASIVGHETKHTGDTIAQLDETLTNIHTILDQANSLYGVPCNEIGDLNALRIYIRHPENSEQILTHLRQQLSGNKCHIIAVQGDICRSDLLLEIEGYYCREL